ncbi:hypothetical protein KTF24_13925 [Burkholderia multivorans]|nr:hypothetical protein [Burkholderia multivorans]MBU9566258.1 hypothetical protein [Burkholderia multivorans]MBU9668877.1 hypothetical protein [Burkholderia multivorans]HEF4754613.1 hypothetical protein [Burkholderia multivorans]
MKRVFLGGLIGAAMSLVQISAGVTICTWQWWALGVLLILFSINLVRS